MPRSRACSRVGSEILSAPSVEALLRCGPEGSRVHDRAVDFRERVRERHGLDVDIETFPEGTETAADAAVAIGWDVAQIASSLVFDADLPVYLDESLLA